METEEQALLELKKPEGKEFWLAFMRNHNNPPEHVENNLSLELFVTSDYDCTVTVEIKALGYRERFELESGTVRNIKLPHEAQIDSSEVLEKGMAVHVSSSEPITVYGLNRRVKTTDTFLALPAEVLGTSYRAICYNISQELMAEFAIAATEDNTRVTITPATMTHEGRQAGRPFEIVLNKGDVYQVAAKDTKSDSRDDLSGSVVTSNKKISFFSGHQCAYVPDGVMACNHLVEQMPPVPSWGRSFYMGILKGRSVSSYRVLADQDSTRVFEDGKLTAVLNAGQYYEKTHSEPVQITSSKPILLAQYSQGFRNGDAIGDPMMLLISPTQQFLKQYRFATPVQGYWEHYINVVVPTDAIGSLRLDGMKLPERYFKEIGISRYSIGYIPISFGTHEIFADEKFGLLSYGFGYDDDQYDAYGNIAGQSFVEYVMPPDVTPPRLVLTEEGNLIARDDRDSDLGLESIEILDSENMGVKIPSFSSGAPQLSIEGITTPEKKTSRVLISLSDVEGNKSLYTLCYSLDRQSGDFALSLSEGEEFCEAYLGVNVTAFAGYGIGVNILGTSPVPGNVGYEFLSSDNSGGYSGALRVSRRAWDGIDVGLRLAFLPASGGATATLLDSLRYFDPSTGVDEPVIQELRLSKNSSFAIEAEIDWEWATGFFAGIGFGAMVDMGETPYAIRSILSPPNAVYYTTGNDESDLFVGGEDNYNTLLPYLSFDFSISRPISRDWEFVPEVRYLHPLVSPINESSWTPSQLTVNLGITYKL